MGIRVGYTVERRDGAIGLVLDTRSLTPDDEPCFATVRWPDGVRHELLRDLRSAPPEKWIPHD